MEGQSRKMDYRFAVKAFSAFRIAFLAAMGVSAIILHSFYEEPISPIAVQLFAWGFLFSLVSWVSLKLIPSRYEETLAWAQVLWDLAATSVLVYQTGTLYSAFALLFTVHILLSGILLRARGAIITALASDVFLLGSTLYGMGWQALSNPESLSRLIFEMSLIAFFGGALAYIARHREKLSLSLEKTQADLKDLSALYSTIVEHIPSGIICLGADRKWIRFMNRAGAGILGSDLTGFELSSTPLKNILLSNERSEIQLSIRNEDRFIGYHASDLPDMGLLVVFQDLTDIRDLESKVRIREKLASVGQLAAGIAHEIRNPLASLSGSIQLMKNDMQPDSNTEKLMKIVLRETDRLDALIKNFLIYAKPSELRIEEIKLNKFIEEIISLIKNQRGKSLESIRWENKIPPHLNLRADFQQLKQIFWNLLLNAVDAVGSRGGSIQISSEELKKENLEWVKILIRDSGVGIPSAIQEKIFDPFFTTKMEGTGLGLSLVYQMVKAHSGSIGLQSQEGSGTTFWLEFLKNGPKNLEVKAA